MRRLLLLLAILISAPVCMQAQKFIYDSAVDYYFDNREFDSSGNQYLSSKTLHSVLLQPEIGLLIGKDRRTEQRVMLGVNVIRDMGSRKKILESFDEMLLYYQVNHKLRRKGCRIEAAAGVFPRSFIKGSYSKAIWSDSLSFYDHSIEGLLIKYSSPSFRVEIGNDWMGQYSVNIRERFQIFSAGTWDINNWLSAGWSMSFYHYANSVVANHDVIDNHLLNPWLKLDFAGWIPILSEVSVQAGLLAGYQRQRRLDPNPVMPLGGEIITRLGWRKLCLQNSIYAGPDQYHYYETAAPEGGSYGSNLYMGEPTYRGFYDRLELAWGPRISKKTSLQLVAAFHFDNGGYLGCQQVFRLKSSF